MTGITIDLFCGAAKVLIDLGHGPQEYPQGERIVFKTSKGEIMAGTGLKTLLNNRQKQYHLILVNDGDKISLGGGTEIVSWGDKPRFLTSTKPERDMEIDKLFLKSLLSGRIIENEEEYNIVNFYEQTGITRINISGGVKGGRRFTITAFLTKRGRGLLGIKD